MGTRATIMCMSIRLLEICLISRDHAGETALIPQISLSLSLSGLGSANKPNRRHFAVQLAIAMTIKRLKVKLSATSASTFGNRCSLMDNCMLPSPVSHQQMKVLLPHDARTNNARNVVHNKVLLD